MERTEDVKERRLQKRRQSEKGWDVKKRIGRDEANEINTRKKL
jgi:hypothetical protein